MIAEFFHDRLSWAGHRRMDSYPRLKRVRSADTALQKLCDVEYMRHVVRIPKNETSRASAVAALEALTETDTHFSEWTSFSSSDELFFVFLEFHDAVYFKMLLN